MSTNDPIDIGSQSNEHLSNQDSTEDMSITSKAAAEAAALAEVPSAMLLDASFDNDDADTDANGTADDTMDSIDIEVSSGYEDEASSDDKPDGNTVDEGESAPSLHRATTVEETVDAASAVLGDDFGEVTGDIEKEAIQTRGHQVHRAIRRLKQRFDQHPATAHPCFDSSSRTWASRDLENYRLGYPDDRDRLNNARITYNVEFYMNKGPCMPNNLLIEELHEQWWGDYHTLEAEHGYIQWLFPIHEASPFNSRSRPLQFHEAAAIRSSEPCKSRLVRSYELMLDFYGFELADRRDGTIRRKPNGWKPCFRNLNQRGHNYLRITRILKCLGELGFEHYKAPFLVHMIEEMVFERQLLRAADSCANYWVPTLKKDADRKALMQLINQCTKKTRRTYSSPYMWPDSDDEEEIKSRPAKKASGSKTKSKTKPKGKARKSSSGEDAESAVHVARLLGLGKGTGKRQQTLKEAFQRPAKKKG